MVWRLSRMKRPNRNIPLAQQLGWLMVILLLLFVDPLAQQLGVMTGKSLGGLSTVVLKRSWRMLLPLKLLSPKVPKENNLIRGLLKLRSLHRYVVVFCFNDWKKNMYYRNFLSKFNLPVLGLEAAGASRRTGASKKTRVVDWGEGFGGFFFIYGTSWKIHSLQDNKQKNLAKIKELATLSNEENLGFRLDNRVDQGAKPGTQLIYRWKLVWLWYFLQLQIPRSYTLSAPNDGSSSIGVLSNAQICFPIGSGAQSLFILS